jgi:hypothetical protein
VVETRRRKVVIPPPAPIAREDRRTRNWRERDTGQSTGRKDRHVLERVPRVEGRPEDADGSPPLLQSANEDFAQCVLFDGNTSEARLMGIEYIISEKLYNTLPPDEKAYWHPHNYEVLSGTLRMPGLPDAAEKEALKTKINSYGKTWHTWMTGVHGQQADALPLGPPHLQWSFNRDGEANPEMVQARDSRMNLNSTEARQQRQDLVDQARPQGGVDAMAGLFPNAKPIPGGRDNGDAATRPVPTFGMKGAEPKPSGQ